MMPHKNIGRRDSQIGFSMIEVLVTMVIVSIGLMGLIALMLKGLQANSSSSMRTIAVSQAYDMADRMRANLAGVQAGNYDNLVPPGSGAACPITAHVSTPTSTALSACASSSSSCATACTVAEIATRDKCAWHQANAKLLPSGSAAVCKDSTKNWYSIHVSWDDDKSGNPSKTFIVRFEP